MIGNKARQTRRNPKKGPKPGIKGPSAASGGHAKIAAYTTLGSRRLGGQPKASPARAQPHAAKFALHLVPVKCLVATASTLPCVDDG